MSVSKEADLISVSTNIRYCIVVLMMLAKPSDERLCYPDYNASCIRAQYSVGAQVGLYVVFGFGILVNTGGNTVVIMSISNFKQLHSPTNVLLLSLAVVDLLVGLIVLPFSMTRTVQGCWYYGDAFCRFHSSTDFFLSVASIFHVVCIAVDRYEAVCNPLRYINNVTLSVAWLMVLACWVVAAFYSYGVIYSKANEEGMEILLESMYCFGSCNFFLNHFWASMDALLFFTLPITVIVCLYTSIFRVAREHARKIEDSNQCAQVKGGLPKQPEHKAAKTLGIVVGVFLFCWMPFCLSTLIDTFIGFSTPIPLLEVFFWLSYLNSSMDPIIYALFYPWFRKCFKLIITLKIFNHNSSDMNVY